MGGGVGVLIFALLSVCQVGDIDSVLISEKGRKLREKCGGQVQNKFEHGFLDEQKIALEEIPGLV